MSEERKKPLMMLVDGHSFMHRAFHAVPHMEDRYGRPTNAIAGALRSFNGLMGKYNPDRFVVCFDAGGKNFRHDILPSYKEGRKSDESLRAQFPVIKQIVQAWGYPMVCVNGVEADDAIGTLAKASEAVGYDVIISTSDKDMCQLVNENIKILNTMGQADSEPYGVDGVIEKMGVHPDRVVDLLSLAGDGVDGVKGVDMVAGGVARKWLEKYGSLDAIIQSAHEIGGKRGESLRSSLGDLEIYKKLVTIDTDVEEALAQYAKPCFRNDRELLELAGSYGLNEFKKYAGVVDLSQVKFEYIECDTASKVSVLENYLLSQKTQSVVIKKGNVGDNVGVGILPTSKMYILSAATLKDLLEKRMQTKTMPRVIGDREFITSLLYPERTHDVEEGLKLA